MNKFKSYCESLLKETEDYDEHEAISDILNAIVLDSKVALEQHMEAWHEFFLSSECQLASSSDKVYAAMTCKLKYIYEQLAQETFMLYNRG